MPLLIHKRVIYKQGYLFLSPPPTLERYDITTRRLSSCNLDPGPT